LSQAVVSQPVIAVTVGWLVGWLGFNGISALTAQIGYNHAKKKFLKDVYFG